MPPHMHHPEPQDHRPHDHHEPRHGMPFSNWGWSNAYVYPETVYVDDTEETPTWVWIVGGALAGMVLAAMGRR